MSIRTWRLSSTVLNDGNFGSLQEAAIGASATRADGWTVAKIAATNASDFDNGTKQASGTFAAASGKPSALITSSAANAFKTPLAYTGTFAATAWTFTFAVRATTVSAQAGRMRMRVYASVNASGASARELTSAAQIGTTSAVLSTTADVTSVVTWSPGAITLNNEYLFFVIAWEVTTASGNNSSDVQLRASTGSTFGSYCTSPDGGNMLGTPIPASSSPVLDNFNRADGAVGANFSTFSASDAALPIASNQVRKGASLSSGLWNPSTFGPDSECFVTLGTLVTSDTEFSLYARMTGSQGAYNGYQLRYSVSSGGFQITRINANVQGNATELVNYAWAVGDKVMIRCVGSTILGAIQPGGTGPWYTIVQTVDPTYTAAGMVGLRMTTDTSGTFRVDDLGGGTYVAPGPKPIPGGNVQATSTVGGTVGVPAGFPTTSLIDNFNRANGVLTAPYVASYNGQGIDQIVSQQVIPTGGSNFGTAKTDTLAVDTETWFTVVTVPAPGNDLKLFGRWVPGAGPTGYYARINGTSWHVSRQDAGSSSDIDGGGATRTLNAGDKVALQVKGNTITLACCPVGSSTWYRVTRATDNTYTNAGGIGWQLPSGTVIDDLGGGQVRAPGFYPDNIPGLGLWLDATQAGITDGADVPLWGNIVNGGAPGFVVGSPNPTFRASQLNGRAVVRFLAGQGRVRVTGAGLSTPFTLAYVAHVTSAGANAGRIGAGISPQNILFGWWSNTIDVLYDGGWAAGDPPTANATTAWKLYSFDKTGANPVRMFTNGVFLKNGGAGTQDLSNGFALSGYDPAAANETSDCEVAEALIYNRQLSDAERQQVEGYLRGRWLPTFDAITPATVMATSTVGGTVTKSNLKISTLVDKFDTSVDTAAKWSNSSGVSWDGAGRALLPCASTYSQLGTSISPASYDLTGSSIYAKPMVPATGNGTREMFMEVVVNPTNKFSMFVSGGVFTARRTLSGTNTQQTATYNPTTHAWWRIREAGGTIFFDISQDGSNWTNFYSIAAGMTITAVSLDFTCGYFGSETASNGYIDNVNITPVAPVTPFGISATSTVSGSIGARRKVAPSQVSAVSTVSGTLKVARGVAPAQVNATSTVAGSIRALRGVLPANVTAVSTVSASPLTVQRKIAGQVSATSTVSGSLTKFSGGPKPIVATQINATSSVGGTLTKGPIKAITGVISATSTVAGSIRALRKLFPANITANSTVSGGLIRRAVVAGQISATSTVSGAVVKGPVKAVAGNVAATSTVSGSFVKGPVKAITGNVSATSVVSGTVSRLGAVRPIAPAQVSATSTVSASIGKGPVKTLVPAAILATSVVSAAVGALRRIVPTPILATSVVSGVLTARRAVITGQISATSTVSGGLRVLRAVRPTQISATSTVSSSIVRRAAVSGQISATSTVSGRVVALRRIAGQVNATSTVSASVTKGAVKTITGNIVATSTVGAGAGVIVTDNFNRANGGLGPNWSAGENSLVISTNTVTASVGPASAAWVGTFGNDQFAEISPSFLGTSASDVVGVTVRMTSNGSDFYHARWFGNAGSPIIQVYKRVAGGSLSQLASSVPTTQPAATDVLRLEVVGNSITVKLNGTPVAGLTAISDASVPSGGSPGVRMNGNSTGDNWRGGDIGAGNAIRVLRKIAPAQINATSTVAGNASTTRKIVTAQISAISTVTGSVSTHPVKIIGGANVSAMSIVSGLVRTLHRIAGQINATSIVSGSLIKGVGRPIAPSPINATSTVSGSIGRARAIVSVNINATTTVTGRVTTRHTVSAQITATSTVSGVIRKLVAISGQISATSTVSGRVRRAPGIYPAIIYATSTVTAKIVIFGTIGYPGKEHDILSAGMPMSPDILSTGEMRGVMLSAGEPINHDTTATANDRGNLLSVEPGVGHVLST
jgi:hypothetical protein